MRVCVCVCKVYLFFTHGLFVFDREPKAMLQTMLFTVLCSHSLAAVMGAAEAVVAGDLISFVRMTGGKFGPDFFGGWCKGKPTGNYQLWWWLKTDAPNCFFGMHRLLESLWLQEVKELL